MVKQIKNSTKKELSVAALETVLEELRQIEAQLKTSTVSHCKVRLRAAIAHLDSVQGGKS